MTQTEERLDALEREVFDPSMRGLGGDLLRSAGLPVTLWSRIVALELRQVFGQTRSSQDKAVWLTPRQNELISEALCHIAASNPEGSGTPGTLKVIRCALVAELEAVTSATDPSLLHRGARSIDG